MPDGGEGAGTRVTPERSCAKTAPQSIRVEHAGAERSSERGRDAAIPRHLASRSSFPKGTSRLTSRPRPWGVGRVVVRPFSFGVADLVSALLRDGGAQDAKCLEVSVPGIQNLTFAGGMSQSLP